ncbi:MAG TPA: RHS repeat-associated core domain-containing protein, partial [Terriglobales bacterium]|nr:RHS repeat-associated core domain-containing protein [Terriglobales bacterium]
GGERILTNSDPNQYKFTGKERDVETGLDYFGARYYASTLGRFMQTDPKARSAHPLNPQSWNRYAYTLNNPLKYFDPDGMDVVLAAGLSAQDRAYVVNNLARMYATPAGKAMLLRADKSQFTITVGTGHLGRTDLTKAPPGTMVFGGQTKVEGGNTSVPYTNYEGHRVLAADNPNTAPGHPIEVTIDKSQAAEIGKDPAQVFAHELGGHTADVLNAAESNPATQFIDSVNPKDETSSEAAEKALGKLPDKPSEKGVKAVEQILKPQCSTDDKGKKVCSQ